MRETVITCDRCGTESRYRSGLGSENLSDFERGFTTVFPHLFDGPEDALPLHVCLNCLDPDEQEWLAEAIVRDAGDWDAEVGA